MSTRVALLFPGQGAKRADAALRAAVRRPEGRALCQAAARAAGVELAQVLARPSVLDRTEVYQPVITAVALAAVGALAAAGVAPAVVLGHSLGEVAAWAAAGGVSVEDAIALAAVRGRLMAREAAAHPGGMVALATDDEGVIAGALEAGRRAGTLEVAARNAPDETVLTGDEAAVRAVLAFAPGVATRVPTGGAWHSRAMEGALAEWTGALRTVPSAEPRCAFVVNRTGDVVTAGEDIPAVLAEQLVRPVAWTRALATAGALADVLVTVGPGAVLRSLWLRNTRSTSNHGGGEQATPGAPGRSDRMGRAGGDTTDPTPPNDQKGQRPASEDRPPGGPERTAAAPASEGGSPPGRDASGTGDPATHGGSEIASRPAGLTRAPVMPAGAASRKMYATEDERSLAETIAALGARRGLSPSMDDR